MPLLPNGLERFLINRGAVPGLLLNLGMSQFQCSALLAALETGRFKHLKADGPLGVGGLVVREAPGDGLYGWASSFRQFFGL